MRVVQGYRPVVDDEEEQTNEVIDISDSSDDEIILSEEQLRANTVKRRKIDHGREMVVSGFTNNKEEEK